VCVCVCVCVCGVCVFVCACACAHPWAHASKFLNAREEFETRDERKRGAGQEGRRIARLKSVWMVTNWRRGAGRVVRWGFTQERRHKRQVFPLPLRWDNQKFNHKHTINISRCLGKHHYGVATVSRIDQITGLFLQNIVSFIGLFCKRDL